jgi:folate-binding protein YgfZ
MPMSTPETHAFEAARAANERVLLVPATDRAAIVVTGKDRTTWMNGLITCDLAKRAPGQAAYGLLVEKKGRIQTDLFVVPSLDDGKLALSLPQELRDTVHAALDHYLIMEDAELETPDLNFFVAHGPLASELVSLAPFGGVVDVLGTGGAVLATPCADGAMLEARLREKVLALGGVVTDDATWERVRIERGLPRFGVEFDTTYYPQEASIEKLAVSFSKGCYLGQEVIYMLENRGHVKRKLVALDLEGDVAPSLGTAVTSPEGESVGEIRSATCGPLGHHVAAIALVKWAHAAKGSELNALVCGAEPLGRPRLQPGSARSQGRRRSSTTHQSGNRAEHPLASDVRVCRHETLKFRPHAGLGAPPIEVTVMRGFITTKDVLLHPAAIIQAFGVRVFVRCLVKIARRDGSPLTFLECI